MAFAILLLDSVTGPYIQFPIFFVLPVSLAAWFCGLRFALVLAVLLPAGRFPIAVLLDQPAPLLYIVINSFIRIGLLTFIACLVRRARQTHELEQEVKSLQGLLPICSFCKKIRDDRQQWQKLEVYISNHSAASFTHGICTECAEQHYGKFLHDG